MLDLCLYPSFTEPIKNEIKAVLSKNELTLAGLAKVGLLDNAMEGSQRFKSASGMSVRIAVNLPTKADQYSRY